MGEEGERGALAGELEREAAGEDPAEVGGATPSAVKRLRTGGRGFEVVEAVEGGSPFASPETEPGWVWC